MAKIRRLFGLPPRKEFKFDDSWKAELRTMLPAKLCIGDEVIQRIELAVEHYLGGLAIVSEMADKKAVLDQLNVIDTHLANCADRWSDIRKGLEYPQERSHEREKARVIALDYLAQEIRVAEPGKMRTVQHEGDAFMLRQKHDHCARDLRRHVQTIMILLNRDNDDLEAHLAEMKGVHVFAGRPFHFQRDPYREPYSRPEGDVLRNFAKQLVLIYEWMGGTASVHRDGLANPLRPPSPFMRFLEHVKMALREDAPLTRNELHSRAQSFLAERKKSS